MNYFQIKFPLISNILWTNIRNIYSILLEVLQFYLVFILLFQTFRILIYVNYPDLFNDLQFFEFIQSIFLGLRFDLSSISAILFIPIVFYIIPFNYSNSLIYRRIISSIIYIQFCATTIFLTADFFYFSFVKRHITNEVLFLLNDSKYLLSEVASHIGLLIIYCVLFFIFYFIFIRKTAPATHHGKRSIPEFIIITLFMIIIGRGGIQMKPIAIIDAYQHGSANLGHLTLNGFFTASHYSFASNFIERPKIDETFALNIINLPKTHNLQYPLEKNYTTKETEKKKNVVVIIVESLTYKYIDYLNEGKKYGVTPNIDNLASDGLVFSNFFANGQRSIEGAQAILTGIPPLPGIPDIISLSVNYSRLGELAEANHYRTIFVTSTLKESFSLDLMVYASGIEEYYGREDYNLLLNYPEARKRTLGWDYETFMLLSDKLSGHSQPFIAFVNASSDHTPFPRMQEPFTKYKHGQESEGGYLNMLHYTDWAIGEFMAKMSKQEYFNDTVFIITADHALAHFQADDPYGKFRIPLILYSPKHIPKGNSERFASQIDIIPSMIDILNLEGKFSNIGKSIFAPSNNFAITKEGSLLNIFAKEGFLQHSLQQVLKFIPSQSTEDENLKNELVEKIQAFDQLTYQLLTENRWAHPNK